MSLHSVVLMKADIFQSNYTYLGHNNIDNNT